MTTSGVKEPKLKDDEPWRPRWWVRFTTICAFGWGLGLGTWEVIGAGRVAVFAFSGALILVGIGLAGAASEVFRR